MNPSNEKTNPDNFSLSPTVLNFLAKQEQINQNDFNEILNVLNVEPSVNESFDSDSNYCETRY